MSSPPIRVVVVDDDASFLGVVTDLLVEQGHEVDATVDVGEALRKVESGSYDVALLDLVMPGLGGLELGDRIQSLSRDTEVLILTGFADIQSAISGIRHGVFDYIDKSRLDAGRLERSVREAATRSRLTRTNRELRASLEETNRRLQTLLSVSVSLSAEPHPDRVLEILVRAARDLVRSASSRALLFGRTASEGDVIEHAAGDGVETILGTRLKPEEGIATLVAHEGKPIRLDRAADHPRYSPRCDAIGDGTAYLAAPLSHGDVRGALIVSGHAGGFAAEDVELLAALARQGAVAVESATAHERAVNFFTHVSEILVSLLETKDVFYPGHSRRVAALSDMVTRRLGLTDAERRSVHFGALLHDIGKLLVDPEVLSAPGPIADANLRAIREHPALALQMLKPITVWEDILPLIHSHHERWDGKGYPLGLSGIGIPLGARVIAVADAFDAMTRQTPHSRQRTPEDALAELEGCAGGQFDPRIVRLFVAEYRARGHQIPPE